MAAAVTLLFLHTPLPDGPESPKAEPPEVFLGLANFFGLFKMIGMMFP